MDYFRRSKKMMRLLAVLVMLSMVFGLMPAAAVAAPIDETAAVMTASSVPTEDTFKFVKLNSANSYYQASLFMDTDQMNYVDAPINLDQWALLTFAIQSAQHMKLMVYEVDENFAEANNFYSVDGVNLRYSEVRVKLL